MSNDTRVDSDDSPGGNDEENSANNDPIFVETRASTRGQTQAQNNSDTIPRSHTRDHELIETYKKMYEQLTAELKARQDELEGAHYRIGQLESQIKYSIPLQEHRTVTLDNKNEILLLTESTKSLQTEIADKLTRLKKIREALYYEKLNKRIYLAIVLALLALQPLWLLLKS